jgi:hypothetical protein
MRDHIHILIIGIMVQLILVIYLLARIAER